MNWKCIDIIIRDFTHLGQVHLPDRLLSSLGKISDEHCAGKDFVKIIRNIFPVIQSVAVCGHRPRYLEMTHHRPMKHDLREPVTKESFRQQATSSTINT